MTKTAVVALRLIVGLLVGGVTAGLPLAVWYWAGEGVWSPVWVIVVIGLGMGIGGLCGVFIHPLVKENVWSIVILALLDRLRSRFVTPVLLLVIVIAFAIPVLLLLQWLGFAVTLVIAVLAYLLYTRSLGAHDTEAETAVASLFPMEPDPDRLRRLMHRLYAEYRLMKVIQAFVAHAWHQEQKPTDDIARDLLCLPGEVDGLKNLAIKILDQLESVMDTGKQADLKGSQEHFPERLSFLLAQLSQPAELELLRGAVCRVHRHLPYLIEQEDLFQEAIMKALAAHRQFAGTSPEEFRAWVARIARNLLFDRLREVAARPALGPLCEETTAAPHAPVEEELARKDWIERALTHLTPLQAAILRARYQGGLSFEQIGRLTGQSAAAIRQLHHRLLLYLRGVMGPAAR